ncbi:serine/threonine-protein kinase [Paracidobacterium acidisoli]|uniref:non-specific serine/threonine protein kinase n=1 Tax=Paracidobacterium acidisoli TaxID=2303751 RepID=A0A372IS94_9BACT|nr:serine/threonine-protein kinase [Paracidobacterium acidisoli]MBT9330768.1 serine/threonine protein kinase [Paracidobacterium acidisoli]
MAAMIAGIRRGGAVLPTVQAAARAGMEIEAGQRVGDYEIIRRIGAGGLGVVYEVHHVVSRRAEAMKILLPNQAGSAEAPERFLREIQLLAGLDHPNIARLNNAFYFKDQLVMVMELVAGETLRHLAAARPVPLPKIVEYAAQVLSALDYAHARGVIHRDIKPANVMVGREERLKLLDFGIATSSQAAGLTQSGYLVGTLSYLSPEQITGAKATARSDIYSAGVTFYELLTGRLPFQGSTYYEVMTAHLHAEPVSPAALNPGVPEALARAIMKALAKNPAERYATAQEFLTALQAVSAGLGDAQSIPTMSIGIPLRSVTGSSGGGAITGGANLPVEEVTRRLATFLGPIAKIIVRRLAAKSKDTDQLYALAAEEIPEEADRRKFLLSRHK